jgi:hypothetical protein
MARTVHLADGTTAHEEVRASERPKPMALSPMANMDLASGTRRKRGRSMNLAPATPHAGDGASGEGVRSASHWPRSWRG